MLNKHELFLVIVLTAIVIIGGLLLLNGCAPAEAGVPIPQAGVTVNNEGLGEVTALGTFSTGRYGATITVFMFNHDGHVCYVAREKYDSIDKAGVGIGISCLR